MSKTNPPLTVIAAPAFKTRHENPYNWLLYNNLKDQGLQVTEFSPLSVWLKNHQIWHFHWPEMPLNHPNKLKMLVKLALLVLSIAIARAKGTKLIWTVHNLQSHDQRYPKLEAFFWQQFTRVLDGYISLSRSGLQAAQARFPELSKASGFIIPHHHYRGEYPDTIQRSEAREALNLPEDAQVILFFGRVRPYKNIEHLIEVFKKLDHPNTILYIVGRPEPALHEAIQTQASQDPRIRLELDFAPLDRAQIYFRAADLVALPYREILNSGSALLALSFDCPVLVPKRGAMAELQQAIGTDWVQTYSDTLTVEQLQTAVDWAIKTPRSASAPLEDYDPKALAHQTQEAYQSLLQTKDSSSALLTSREGA
jgi:beta-1,4-mannosyltransferase